MILAENRLFEVRFKAEDLSLGLWGCRIVSRGVVSQERWPAGLRHAWPVWSCRPLGKHDGEIITQGGDRLH